MRLYFLIIRGNPNDLAPTQGPVADGRVVPKWETKVTEGEVAYFRSLKLQPISLAQVMPKTETKRKLEDHLNYSGNLWSI